MNRLLGLALVGGIAFSFASCSNSPGGRALNGALIGGSAGAIVGGLVSSHPTSGALIGGAIGATTGALLGAATAPPPPASPSIWPSWL